MRANSRRVASRTFLFSLFAAGAGAAVAASAAAQCGRHQPVHELPDVRPDNPAGPAVPASPGEVLRAAGCAIGRNAGSANALLATVPRSVEERSQSASFIRGGRRCQGLPTEIRTSAQLVRGAAAESLYEAQFAAPPAPRTPEVGVRPMTRPGPSRDPAATGLESAFALAECTAARSPELVRALLATAPMTAPEQGAFSALDPAFLACVVPGSQIQVGARGLRSLLAEALYRWSVAQRDGPAAQ